MCDFLLLQAICSAAAYYAEMTHQKLADSGYYEEQTPYKTTDEVIAQVEILLIAMVTINDQILCTYLRVRFASQSLCPNNIYFHAQ